MPRRNLLAIFGALLISLACYHTADRNPFGRYFSEVVDRIENQYVEPVDRNKLWTAAVRGMVGELHDPYSHYDDPEVAARLEEDLEQKFAGVGLLIDRTSERLTVGTPIVGSPAYRAGIMAGDVITKIGDKSTEGMTVKEASSLMRGDPGTSVHLTIERAGEGKPIELTVNREIVNVDSVLGDTRLADDQWNFLLDGDKKIGYVRINTFGERTVAELGAALEKMKQQGAKGLIIDLRGNPGGLLPAAKGVCEFFIPKGKTIVSVRGRQNQMAERRFVASGGEKFLDWPLAVLVNHGSASASEIVAACLQDHHRAVVIGERTFGKGTVQNIIPLNKELGKLTLTTANYLRPSEKPIHRRQDAKESEPWGVLPDTDYELKLSTDEAKNWGKWRQDRDVVRPHRNAAEENDASSENGGEANGESAKSDDPWKDDPQLHRAIEYIESKIKTGDTKTEVAA
jgi:carboxyl-terminal processing protease